ncbi:TetR/AcrR family transcriptional regulator [Lacticaseibacillus pabuli]|uniref:TetR/AcrR family transcriptional regulator n=1 Tax=Lacticaseibacillus pabuli TaxID=3025672 RepID=A0ABY7WQQ3_9LACO|nr:TetR/AcrR family transcriptional regulator [Lacticaseibacillus sp. KACC 23028]WDF81698.1 TetR/AcrR family transcriptional regulator [Lacticaseibacillus sp. KACC 23028]
MSDMRKFKSERDIQAGLIACLKQRSFSEITIDNICEQAMVGRSTFYHHYTDKYALLEAMVARRAATFDQLLGVRLATPADDEPLLVLYRALVDDAPTIVALLQVHERSGDLSQSYLHILAKHADHLLPQANLPIPRSFALELYSSTALTAIRWALVNGDAQSISQFMNRLMRDVISKEA